jgi:hypothetical protein
VFLAHGVQSLQPTCRWNEDTARTLDGFGVEGRNAARAEFRDFGPQGRDRCIDDRLRVGTNRIAIGVVRRNFVLPVVWHAETRMESRDRGQT